MCWTSFKALAIHGEQNKKPCPPDACIKMMYLTEIFVYYPLPK